NSNLRLLRCSENELTELNLKNGNNQNIERMWAYENPNLVCIQIDDESATYPVCDMPNFIGWCKDETAYYSEFCDLGIENFIISEIVIFPNPATNILKIQSNHDIDRVHIYSIQGLLIREFQ